MSRRTVLTKLRTMSPAEIAGRLYGRVYASCERVTVDRLSLHSDDRFRRALHVDVAVDEQAAQLLLRCHMAAGTLDTVANRQRTRDVVRARHAESSRAATDTAERLLRGEVVLFGEPFAIGPHAAWHVDPRSGRRWPLVYHGDVPIGVDQPPFGDPKDVWELNRHQFLVDVAKAFFLTEDPRYYLIVRDLVQSWIDDNPCGLGVNWAGPLEVAYRALSWLWMHDFLLPRLAGPDAREFHLRWTASFLEHARFLHRHLELYSSPYNHLIGEAAVLYVLGVAFPEAREADAWRRRGKQILESRIDAQFYADGGSVEQATVYHHATLGFLLLAALRGRADGDEFSTAVWQRIERAIEFSMYLLQPDGHLPAIGDNDDARPLGFDRRDLWDFRHFQAAGAVLFDRGDFKRLSGGFHEDAFWLLGHRGAERYDQIAEQTPTHTSVVLGSSGYVALRTDWSGQADYVCLDCGHQAGGLRTDSIPSTAHGHADALSVLVTLTGEPVLIDAGFFTYARETEWERFFRQTAAHNTVRLDGRDQAMHLGKMAWCDVPRVRVEDANLETSGGWVRATHDGYARGANGMIHTRTVWLRPDHLVLIYDDLEGAGEHDAELCFQFPAQSDVTLTAEGAEMNGRFLLCWSATERLSPSLSCGGRFPDSGWVAPSLGVRVPAPRLVLGGHFMNSLRILTAIADRRTWHACADGTRAASLRMRFVGGGMEEAVVAGGNCAPDSVLRDTDAPLAVWRFTHGAMDRQRAGGSFQLDAPSGKARGR